MKEMRLTVLVAVGLGVAWAPGAAVAGGELNTVRVASGLNRPTEVVAAPGDTSRLFILEQPGIIKILDLNTGEVLPTPFLNIDPSVSNGYTGNGERGLLSLAFHPKYFVPGDPNEGHFFVHYSANNGATTVERFRVSSNPNVADINDRLVILSMFQPFPNHNGGQLAFGPCDGFLYIALGDGGAANDPSNRAQNLNMMFGKLLRINVDNASADTPYEIPPDNPFVGQNALGEIWAYGLRNPWRFSFDRITGDLYIGDVGQNAREEIDFQPAASTGGENYGWRCMEGNRCTGFSGCECFSDALTDPIHEYFQGVNGFSVTGGHVYRGCQIPSIRGHYFFADFVSGRIWSFKVVDGAVTDFQQRDGDLNPPDAGGIINQISSFGVDAQGEIYIVDRGGATTGQVFKIVPEGGQPPPDGNGPTVVHTGEDGSNFSGYIDPRRESTNGTDLNAGLRSISIKFSEPVVTHECTLVDTTTASFSLNVTGGTSPMIESVETCDNQVVTVRLDRSAPLREWTTLIADLQDLDGNNIESAGDQGPGVNEVDRVDVGFLPGDIDQTAGVNPLDLLAFKQFVNGIATPPRGVLEDFIDIDRNGLVNPLDLLAFKQLINGISPPSTQTWAGATMNSTQP